MNTLNLLVVDDDRLYGRILKANLDRPGRIRTEVVSSAEEAASYLAHHAVQAVLTDLSMPGMGGLGLVRHIRETDRSLPIIIMTADGTVERAVEGLKAGANEFLQKPLNVSALLTLVERAVGERPIRDEITERQEQRAAIAGGNLVFGSDPRLDSIRQFAFHLASAPDARVLITGETGTGKSLLARAIHDLSGASGRFVEVNCAALPPQLLESELFGHEKGAFTDAKALKRGLIEVADRGTLLLDEIGTMPLELQAKLLLFLETREIRRVGGTQPIQIRTRVIAATNDDLRQRVRDKAFRQDLLYRLDVASVEMPPLREMPAVIPELAGRFVRELCADLHRGCPQVNEQSFAALADYPWPGNARELRNAVERAIIFHAAGPFRVCPPAYSDESPASKPGVTLEFGLTLEEVERQYLRAVLEDNPRDLADIAGDLGISRKTLWEKRRRYDL